jgi:hypothetical protein
VERLKEKPRKRAWAQNMFIPGECDMILPSHYYPFWNVSSHPWWLPDGTYKKE